MDRSLCEGGRGEKRSKEEKEGREGVREGGSMNRRGRGRGKESRGEQRGGKGDASPENRRVK